MLNPKKQFDLHLRMQKKAIAKDSQAKELLKCIRHADKHFCKIHRTEDTDRDISWVDTIEAVIPHLSTIVENPRSFLKTVNYLVPAELAKRTGPDSIRHLSTHSQYVKKIEPDGSVIPSKVLTNEGEVDVQIYENRFVATMLQKLYLYVERRYVYLKHFASLQDMDIFYLDTSFKLGDIDISATTSLKLAVPAEATNSLRKQLVASLARVEEIRKYVSYFMNSPFMREDMKGYRTVQPPIMETNLLRANPDYHAAFLMWSFLIQEEKAKMQFVVNEEAKGLSKAEQERIDLLNYLTTLDLINAKRMKTVKYTKNKYEAEVIPSPDDLLYLNSKFKPFELIRADEQYYDDLAAPLKQELSGKSKAIVQKAFAADKLRLDKIERQKKAALALKKRKEQAAKKLARRQELERKKEAAQQERLAKLESQQALRKKADELELLRQRVRNEALEGRKMLSDDKEKTFREFSSAKLQSGKAQSLAEDKPAAKPDIAEDGSANPKARTGSK